MNRIPPALKRRQGRRWLAGLPLLAVLAADAAGPDQPADADAILASNLAGMAGRPGILELDWRAPAARQRVPGTSPAALAVDARAWPETASLQAVQAFSERHGGRGLMISHADRLVLSGFAEGNHAGRHFAGFSMHKTVLAVAVLAAIEDGIIASLDEAIGRYLPEWAADERGRITLRQLLTQTSGLRRFPFDADSPLARALALSSRVSQAALAHPLEAPPGSAFNYNNANSQLAGLVLTNALRARGLDYAQYLGRRLWQPLGNADAGLWLEAPGGSPRFYAGLEAGLADWLRLGRMIANGGRVGERQLLQPGSIATLLTPSPRNPAYGLGIWLGADWQPQRRYGPDTPLAVTHSAPYLAPDVAFLDGFGGQRVYIVPSAGLVVARASEVDLTYDDAWIVNELLRALIRGRADVAMQAYRQGAGEAEYRRRFAELSSAAGQQRGLAAYEPQVRLRGVPGGTALPLAAGPPAWLDADTRQWLDELALASNTRALLLWHRGELVFEEYYGGAGVDTALVSRSLSKPLAVIATGRAIAEGFIAGLDTPVAQFIHEWRDTDRATITVGQLLQMRSGLAPQGFSREPGDIMNRAYLHPYHAEAIIADYPLVAPPGSRYDYSNANGELIAVLLERATGRRYEDWNSEAVLVPLGASGGSNWVNRPGGTAHSGCCALLPARDWLRLSVLLLNEGRHGGKRLLTEAFWRAMTSSTPQNRHAGMGVYLAGPYVEWRGAGHPGLTRARTYHAAPYLDEGLFLFDGNANQVSYHVPRHQLVIMRLGDPPPKDSPWENTALPNRILARLRDVEGVTLVPQSAP